MNKYNSYTKNFVAEPLISDTWGNLWSDVGATTPVTVGSTLWYPFADSSKLKMRPFYNRLNGDSLSQINCFFYKYDQAYLHDLTIYCNFADGLVRQGAPTQSPVNTGSGAVPTYVMNNVIKVRINSYYWDQYNNVQGAGSIDLVIPHFNSLNKVETILPGASLIPSTAKARWFEIELKQDTADQFALSTRGIDSGFQSSRCLVWAEAVISHTFNTNVYSDVSSGSGWPTT